MDDTPIKNCLIWCAFLWPHDEGSTRPMASDALIAMLWRCGVDDMAAAIETADDSALYYQAVHRCTLGRTNWGVNSWREQKYDRNALFLLTKRAVVHLTVCTTQGRTNTSWTPHFLLHVEGWQGVSLRSCTTSSVEILLRSYFQINTKRSAVSTTLCTTHNKWDILVNGTHSQNAEVIENEQSQSLGCNQIMTSWNCAMVSNV